MNTFGIPNQIIDVPENQEVGLYVRYPVRANEETSYWKAFVQTDYNSHQIEALKLFVQSGLNEMDVSVPHSQGGIFVAHFKKVPRINENYNDIYTYTREDGQSVRMMVSYSGQIGFINRISCEPV